MDGRDDLDAWAAGLFEGEGTVVTNQGRPRLAIKMTDYDCIAQFHAVMGSGYLRGPYQPPGNRKPVWMWYSSSFGVRSCARRLWPYLKERRRARFIEAGLISQEDLLNDMGVPYDDPPVPRETPYRMERDMKSPLTNRALGVSGDANTVPMTVRVPRTVADWIDSHLDEQFIRNRSEYLQHWAQVGMRVMLDPELTEALDWALERSVQDRKPEFSLLVDESLVVRGPVTTVVYELDDTVAEVLPPEPVQTDELTSLRESQLEALRSRVH